MMVSKSRSVVAALSVVLMAVLLAGCSALPEGDLPVVSYANFKVYDPVYVAIENGYFAENGIEVDLVGDNLAGPTAIQAVSSGRIQAGLSSIPALINANAAGLPVIGVTDIQSAFPDRPLEKFYVLADSGIETAADLKGKRVAVNLWRSSFHYTWLIWLADNGVDPEDVTFVLLPFGEQAPALASGAVDAIGLLLPYSSAAEAVMGDDLRVLFTDEDAFGSKQFTLHFVNRIWAEENPDQAAAFVAGVAKAADWIEANQEEAAAIVAEYTGIDAALIDAYYFQDGAEVVMDDVGFWLDLMIERGDIEADWLAPEDIASNRYR